MCDRSRPEPARLTPVPERLPRHFPLTKHPQTGWSGVPSNVGGLGSKLRAMSRLWVVKTRICKGFTLANPLIALKIGHKVQNALCRTL